MEEKIDSKLIESYKGKYNEFYEKYFPSLDLENFYIVKANGEKINCSNLNPEEFFKIIQDLSNVAGQINIFIHGFMDSAKKTVSDLGGRAGLFVEYKYKDTKNAGRELANMIKILNESYGNSKKFPYKLDIHGWSLGTRIVTDFVHELENKDTISLDKITVNLESIPIATTPGLPPTLSQNELTYTRRQFNNGLKINITYITEILENRGIHPLRATLNVLITQAIRAGYIDNKEATDLRKVYKEYLVKTDKKGFLDKLISSIYYFRRSSILDLLTIFVKFKNEKFNYIPEEESAIENRLEANFANTNDLDVIKEELIFRKNNKRGNLVDFVKNYIKEERNHIEDKKNYLVALIEYVVENKQEFKKEINNIDKLIDIFPDEKFKTEIKEKYFLTPEKTLLGSKTSERKLPSLDINNSISLQEQNEDEKSILVDFENSKGLEDAIEELSGRTILDATTDLTNQTKQKIQIE